MKKNKLQTPAWILEGYDSEADYIKSKGISSEGPRTNFEDASAKYAKQKKKGNTFKIRECPECGSDEVSLVLSNSDAEEDNNTGKQWGCKKCDWKGADIIEKELDEGGLMKYLDKKGVDVA